MYVFYYETTGHEAVLGRGYELDCRFIQPSGEYTHYNLTAL